MRRIRYQVACSLDGYIAGPKGEFDWIPNDPDIDFDTLFAEFDTLIMGRKTYEILPLDDLTSGRLYVGKKLIVVSRTLRQEEHPRVTVVPEVSRSYLDNLRSLSGKDIWLFGGGELFRALLEMGVVDTVELAVVPILLGGGIPFLPPPAHQRRLRFTGQRSYERSGIVFMNYTVRSEPSSEGEITRS